MSMSPDQEARLCQMKKKYFEKTMKIQRWKKEALISISSAKD